MSNIFEKFQEVEAEYKRTGGDTNNTPLGVEIEKIISPTEAVVMGKKCLMLGSNNYLSLTFNDESIKRATEALHTEGTGTTGSRVANGNYASHQKLEKQVADFFGRRHAMLFTTGYQANVGFISSIAGKNDVVLIDADSHASIYDGCRLSSATTLHFRHNNPADLERRLKRLPADVNKLVIVEGIYSMLGDKAPLVEMVKIAKRYGAYVAVDEAHSFGVLGETGQGLVEEAGVEDEVDFIIGTFSKSVGTIGGFCVSNHPELEILRFAARPYIFTASLPSSIIAAASASLERMKTDTSLREGLWRNTTMLYDGLKELGFKISKNKTPIIAVFLPDMETSVHVWRYLIENNIYVNLAVPPATPKDTYLLRCSVSSAHTPAQLQHVLDVFANVQAMLAQKEKTQATASSENRPYDRPAIAAAMR